MPLRYAPSFRPLFLLVLLALAFCLSPPAAQAQQPADLFISEYVEGSSLNKAVEIYNGTGQAVDLGGYELFFSFNGGTFETALPLSGSLPDGDVYVVADDGADAAILAVADLTPGSSFFNGDDAVVLRRAVGGAVVDALGQVGVDPGSEWGSGLTSTQNNTLVRLPSACAGDTDAADGFDPAANYGGFPEDAFDDLGGHAASCGGDPPPPEAPALVINELHADPASGPAGDANGDGTRDFAGDEFVEIVNPAEEPVDVSGWTLSDEAGLRHTFPSGTVIGGACAAVLFGGGAPAGDFGAAAVQTASSGALGLNNGGDTVTLLDGTGNPVAAVAYGGEGGNDQSLVRDPDVTGAFALHTAAAGGARFSPGTQTDGTRFAGCAPSEPPPTPVAEIFEIQGRGRASPFEGQRVTTEDNVVTAVGPEGFFIQTPAARAGAAAETSNGLYVFTGSAPSVQVGDLVVVTGEAAEFHDFTELTGPVDVAVTGSGVPLPPPVAFDAATPSPERPQPETELERFEGMRVAFSGVTTSGSQGFGSDPVAEAFVVTGETRAFREPGIAFPGRSGLPVWDGNPEVFELDPDKLGLPNQTLFAGTEVTATGPLGFEFGGYEVWATELSTGAAPPDVRPVPAAEAGAFTVGSLNLFRLFDDVDDPGSEDNGQVPSSDEYATRLTKFSRYIRTVLRAPDVLAVQEAEKLGVLEDLAARIQGDDPSVTYTAYLEEGNDIGGIDVGFLVRSRVQVDAVTQRAADEVLPFDGSLLHDRPPLLLEGQVEVEGAAAPISVLAVHNRSLGGIDDAGRRGERVRAKRLAQAESIARIAQDLQEANPEIHLVIAGDFNAYQFTDGYVDVVGRIQGAFDDGDDLVSGSGDLVNPDLTNEVLRVPAAERYSFVFQGSAQVLDHALTSRALAPKVTRLAYGHGNADAPEILEADPATAARSSDHDGLVLYIDAAPPEITVREAPLRLSPPNHKYRAVAVEDFVTGVAGADLDVYVTAVTSDEPENGRGDGNTTDDIVIAGCQAVQLRAERSGRGDGRVYHIEVAAHDAAGNVGTARFPVWVPRGRKKASVDSGAAYTVEAESGCAESPSRLASGGEEALAPLPDEWALQQNVPNPFRGTTRMAFDLPAAAPVRLAVYDVTGREVARLVDRAMGPGHHELTFDGGHLASGVYFCRLVAGSFSEVRRMVLVK